MSSLVKTRRILSRVGFGAALFFGVALVGAFRDRTAAGETPSVSAGPEGHFRPGTVGTFALGYKTSSNAELATPGARPLGANVSLRGALEVRAYGEPCANDGACDARALGLRLVRVDEASLTALDRDTADPTLARELAESDAVLTLDERGAAIGLAFSDGSTTRARRILRGVYLELGAEIAGARRGASEVDTGAGRATVTSSVAGDTRVATRTGYGSLDAFPDGFAPAVPKVAATDVVEVGAHDEILSLRSEESLEVRGVTGAVSGYAGRTELSLRRETVTARALGEPPSYQAGKTLRDVGELAFDRKASLERRAQGVGFDTVLADVGMAAAAPRAGLTEWIWHDTAWLELHPEEADHLLATAEKKGRDVRRTAFEILVATGTKEAQASLVRELERGAFADPEEQLILLQRLSYLREPTAATAAYVARVYANERHRALGFGAAHTLGAIAAATGPVDADAASELVAPIVLDLAAAGSAEERASLVLALGNAGFPSIEREILPYAEDADSELRYAVARGLRRTGTVVPPALLALADDAEPIVAEAALDSLFRKEPSDADLEELARIVRKDTMPRLAQGRLVTGLGEHRARSAVVSEILVELLASPTLDTKLRQMVEGILRAS